MANCPKCGYKLKFTDWRPECPKCGVNLVYYQMEERLRADADKAEHEQAKFQPKMDRLKASVYGSTLAKIRIASFFLPVIALLVPLGKISLNLPYAAANNATTVNLIAIVNTVMDLDFGLLTTLTGSPLLGREFVLYMVSLVCILLTVVCFLANLIVLVMSFGKKGIVRNVTINVLGAVFCIVSAVTFKLLTDGLNEKLPGLFSGNATFGIAAAIAGFIVIIVINLMFKIKHIEVKYTDVSELLLPYHERKVYKEEQAKKLAEEMVAKGEILPDAATEVLSE